MKNDKFDRASYRNKGGVVQSIISAYKILRYGIHAGKNCVIKKSVDFTLTDNAYLEIGDEVIIQDFAWFQLTKPNPKVIIGDDTVIGRYNIIGGKNLIKIGSHCRFGSFVQILDTSHDFKRDVLIKDQNAIIGETIIGDDVWLGVGVKVLVGVTIGDGAVIGANAVVNRDIPSNAIAVGVPAKVVKYRE